MLNAEGQLRSAKTIESPKTQSKVDSS